MCSSDLPMVLYMYGVRSTYVYGVEITGRQLAVEVTLQYSLSLITPGGRTRWSCGEIFVIMKFILQGIRSDEDSVDMDVYDVYLVVGNPRCTQKYLYIHVQYYLLRMSPFPHI